MRGLTCAGSGGRSRAGWTARLSHLVSSRRRHPLFSLYSLFVTRAAAVRKQGTKLSAGGQVLLRISDPEVKCRPCVLSLTLASLVRGLSVAKSGQSAAAAESSDWTGSSCGTSATAMVYEDISDDETEQTRTGFSATETTNIAIEYEDITDDENDPPKTFHFYGAKNVGVAGASKDIFAEVQDFSKHAYNQLSISLITPKLAPTCPKELERSFQEAQIFTVGELSDCTAPEIEVHFRIQNPAHVSKYMMTQIALADFWAQFLKAEEAQMKKADRLEKEQTETQESGCGPGPSTSTGGGWFMPLDDLSINLLRLPVDQATALLDGARSNGTKLSE